MMQWNPVKRRFIIEKNAHNYLSDKEISPGKSASTSNTFAALLIDEQVEDNNKA